MNGASSMAFADGLEAALEGPRAFFLGAIQSDYLINLKFGLPNGTEAVPAKSG